MKTRLLSRFVPALLLAAVTFTASAAAVPASQNITTPGGVEWETWTGSGGWTIGDASYAGHGDAYDNGWLVFVNGVGYSPGTVDLTGTTLTGPVQSMSGLNVTVQYYFAPNTAVARILATFHNPGPASVPATVYVPTNFGSDGSTIYQATSSGDNVVTTADRWLITSDTGPSDPVNTSVLYGPGAAEVPTAYTTTVHSSAGTQGIGATFQLDVPAGGTQSLMFFAGLNGITSPTNTVAAAQSAVTSFDTFETLLPEWLSGMSSTQLGQVVNWTAGPVVPPTTCASEGYTGTKLEWCKNICERGYTGSTLAMWIRRWTDRYRTLPYCAAAPQPTLR